MKNKIIAGTIFAVLCICIVAGLIHRNKIDYNHRAELARQARQVGLLGFCEAVQKNPKDMPARI